MFIKIALYTAARSGAILDLEWDRVDLDRRRINFGVPGRRLTKKERATVPISDDLFEVLEEAQERATTDYVIEWGGHKCESVKGGFSSAVVKAGLKDVVPYTLRHTSATWMAQAGIPVWEISRMLGHKDSKTTERVYMQHSPEFLKNAAKSISLT